MRLEKLKSYAFAIGIAVIFMTVSAQIGYSQIVSPCSNPPNDIVEENCRPGSANTEWQIPMYHMFTDIPADNHEVEGYASATSVTAGNQIRFHLSIRGQNPNQPETETVTFKIFRLGYYDGLGARLVHSGTVPNVPERDFPVPKTTGPDPEQTGLAECNWPSDPAAYWNVPSDAVSGVYLVRLYSELRPIPTGGNAKYQSYIPFVVKKPSASSATVFKIGVNTHQAYNPYPGFVDCAGYDEKGQCTTPLNSGNGKSLYPFPVSGGPALPGSSSQQARKVSFNRPYLPQGDFKIYNTAGTGFFNYEYPMIRYLEEKGVDVSYITDVDAEVEPTLPGPHVPFINNKMLISAGHDEYWSWNMRHGVEQARNRSEDYLNIGFFGGNNVYWQVRYENSGTNTFPANTINRTLVCYKETASDATRPSSARDPFYNDTDPTNNYQITDLWRKNQMNSVSPHPSKPPEDELVGVMTIPPGGDNVNNGGGTHTAGSQNGGEPIYCCWANQVGSMSNAPNWIKAGTSGQTLFNLIGYESDELYRGGPGASDNPTPYPNHNPTVVVSSSDFLALRKLDNSGACYVQGTKCILRSVGSAETTIYSMNAGAKVFAASGQQWAWGLDDWGADSTLGPTITSRLGSKKEDARIITENIIDCFTTNAPALCGQ